MRENLLIVISAVVFVAIVLLLASGLRYTYARDAFVGHDVRWSWSGVKVDGKDLDQFVLEKY